MTRRVLLVPHPKRPDIGEITRDVAARLGAQGVQATMIASDASALRAPDSDPLTVVPDADAAQDCELVAVLGGDGTILRGAELARGTDTPLLGINLGKVGFLAEVEMADLTTTVDRIDPATTRSRTE